MRLILALAASVLLLAPMAGRAQVATDQPAGAQATSPAVAGPQATTAQAAGSPAGQAAAPPPDKSGFTLFNPTPTADLRSLCTDRPTKSTGTCTIDAGHFQIESDIVNYTYDRVEGFTTETWLVTNPNLKLGLTNTVDFELNMAPYEIVDVHGHGLSSRVSGIGDLYARLKWNLLGDDGGNVAFALVPILKIPTASKGLGNGVVEEGFVAPVVLNLPKGWQLTIDPELDDLENADDRGRHLNTSGLLSFSRAVGKTLTASVEVWSDVNFDPAGTVTQYSADLGLAWIPASDQNLQLDGGVNLGLNRATPAAQIYIGISRRF